VVTALEAIVFGLLQGLLEWLPVSSEGNLALLMVAWLGLSPAETLRTAVLLHFGTGAAALVYYRDEVVRIVLGVDEGYRRMRLLLAAITLVTGAVGLPVYLLLNLSLAEGETLLALTGLALVVTGLMQRSRGAAGSRGSAGLSWGEALGLGVVQGLSIIPGLSRSAVTTTLLLVRGYSPPESLRVSFLMSIPASFAASLGLMLIEDVAVTQASLISISVAAMTGFLALGALVRVAERVSFWKVCVGLGVVALLGLVPGLVGLVTA
jgi:undecaprenyl-diphosphatase